MRLLGFLAFMVFCGNCSCFPYMLNNPYHPFPHRSRFDTFSTARPRVYNKDSNKTLILKTAVEVLETLGNTTLQSFATTFLKIKQNGLLAALKGVSIAARLMDVEYDYDKKAFIPAEFLFKKDLQIDKDLQLTPEEYQLTSSIEKSLKKLSEKVYSDTNFHLNSLNDFTYEKALMKLNEELKGKKNDSATIDSMHHLLYFNTAVVVPINKTSHSMAEYVRTTMIDQRDPFRADYHNTSWDQVLNNIFKITPLLLGSKMNISGYDKDVFEELRSNITRCFFQAFIIQYFEIGDRTTTSDSNELKIEDALFKEKHRQFVKVIKKANQKYHNSWFNGIEHKIVGSTIERLQTRGNNGSNCLIASLIRDELDKKFPWRKYVVILADDVNDANSYGYFAFPKRRIHYKNFRKIALVFMATKNATENKLKHYIREEAFDMANMNDKVHLNSAFSYAETGNMYYQMAAFDAKTRPCASTSNSNFTDFFKIDIDRRSVGVFVVL